MKRNLLIKIHLYLSGFFAPFLLLMTISGTTYLLSLKGDKVANVVKQVQVDGPLDEIKVRAILKDIDPSYSFDYIKGSEAQTLTRPTSKIYYEFKKEADYYSVFKVEPSFLYALFEIHKGHGPKLMRGLEIFMGIGLLLILITGMWIGITTARDKKITLLTMTFGFITFLIFALLL